jgi:hypothetical protein
MTCDCPLYGGRNAEMERDGAREGAREIEQEREQDWEWEQEKSGVAQECAREAIGPVERILGSGGERGKVPRTVSCLMEAVGEVEMQ